MWRQLNQVLVPVLLVFSLLFFQTVSAQQWTIEEPTLDYQGLQLILEYTISNPLKEGDASVTFFQDDAFKQSVADGDTFLKTEIFYDGSSGTQKVAVTMDVDKGKILGSPFVSSVGSRSIVSFGTRLSIRDPRAPSQSAAHLDTPIIFELMTDGGYEITGFLQDQAEKYGVTVFECDTDNNRIPFVQPKTQQDFLRVCIQPDEFTHNDAVKLNGISAFTLQAGQNTQEVIKDGAVQNLGSTDNGCVRDGKLCYISASIDNSFFATPQTVAASGIARLQYIKDNGRRQLIDAPIRIRRRTRTTGGPAGDRSFDISFAVEPSTASYGARAYLCDQRQKELSEDEIEPKGYGDGVTICVTPDQDAQNDGVFIRDISSFVFRKDGEEQYLQKPDEEEGELIQDGQDPDDLAAEEESRSKTLYDCAAGEKLCAFRLLLDDVFFNGDPEPIEGEGQIELQFGSGKSTWSRRTKVSFSSARPGHQRSLQNNDPDFAGVASVSLSIPVDPSSTPPPFAWSQQSLNFWTSMPTYGRVLIILGIAVIIIACLLCGLCFVFGMDTFDFLPFDLPHFMTKHNDFKEDFERDYTDPEDCRGDTEEELKGDGGRGRSLDCVGVGRSASRPRSRMRSISPTGKNGSPGTKGSYSTQSLSSHSRGEFSDDRGKSRIRSKGRVQSMSPDRISKSLQSLLPSSFHRQGDKESHSELWERSRVPAKGRMKSMSPSRRKSGNSVQSIKSASAHGRILPGEEGKTRKKSASSHSRSGLASKSERKERSVQPPKNRTRSLSPRRSAQATTPEGQGKANGKFPKSASAHGPPNKKKSQGPKSLKTSSAHTPLQEPPKRKKSFASSSHSRKGPPKGKQESSSSTHSRRKLKRSGDDNMKSSAHSIGSCSTMSEISIHSGTGHSGTKKKGRKSDTLSLSSHSVQSFASSGGSLYSTDSEMDFSTDTATGEVKRGKRPTAKKGKKKKAGKMNNTNDIIAACD